MREEITIDGGFLIPRGIAGQLELVHHAPGPPSNNAPLPEWCMPSYFSTLSADEIKVAVGEWAAAGNHKGANQ